MERREVAWEEQTDVTFRGADGVFYHIPKAALKQYAVPEEDTGGYLFQPSGPVKLGPGVAGGTLPGRPSRRLLWSSAADGCDTQDSGLMGCPG